MHTLPNNTLSSDSRRIIKGFDVLKFLMALVVVAIHCGIVNILEGTVWNSLIRSVAALSVPTFFVVSSFLFFKKIRNGKGITQLIDFEKRINILYLFWIVSLLPFVLLYFHKDYLEVSFIDAFLAFLKDYFFCSVFNASWYLSATIVGMPIVFFLSKVLTDKFLWLPVLVLYFLIQDPNGALFCWYEDLFRTPLNSFPYALLWLTIGYYLSLPNVLSKIKDLNKWYFIIVLCIYTILSAFFFEYVFIFKIFAVPSLVVWAYNSIIPLQNELCSKLRVYSTHFYCMHTSVLIVLTTFVHNSIIKAMLCYLVCWTISEIILRVKKWKCMKWLKYSY